MNKIKKRCFFISVLLIPSISYWAQENSQQSVDFQKKFSTYKDDTNKVNLILDFIQSQEGLDYTSFKYLQEALRLSNNLKYTEGQYATNIELYYYFSNVQVNNMKALKAANSAMIVAEKINKPKKLIEAYQLVGHYYRNANKNRTAAEYMLKALNVANKTHNAEASFTIGNDLGIAHPNSDTALIYLKQSLRILDSVPNFNTKAFGGRSKKELLSIVLNNMGNVYSRTGKSAPTVQNVEEIEHLTEKLNKIEKKDNTSPDGNSIATSNEKQVNKKQNKKKEKTVSKEIFDYKNEKRDYSAKKEDTLVRSSHTEETTQIEDNTSENSKTTRFILLLILCVAALIGAYYYKKKKGEV